MGTAFPPSKSLSIDVIWSKLNFMKQEFNFVPKSMPGIDSNLTDIRGVAKISFGGGIF